MNKPLITRLYEALKETHQIVMDCEVISDEQQAINHKLLAEYEAAMKDVRSAEEHLIMEMGLVPFIDMDDESMNCVFKAMEAYAAQFQAKQDDGWIRVEDGLPEKRSPWIVWAKLTRLGYVYFMQGFIDTIPECTENQKITHWRKIPDPPKH